MELKTPTNGLIKNGELYGIRNAYSKILTESVEKKQKDMLFKTIYETVKTADFDKLTKFAKKNTKLATMATKNAIANARKSIKCCCDEATVDEVCKKVETIIISELPKPKKLSAKQMKSVPTKIKAAEIVSINEAGDYDDADDSDDSEPDVSGFSIDRAEKAGLGQGEKLSPEILKEIDRITKDVKYDRELTPEMKRDLAKQGIDTDDIDDVQYTGKEGDADGRDATTKERSRQASSARLMGLDNRPGMSRMSDEFDNPNAIGREEQEPHRYFDYCVQSIRMCVTVGNEQLGKPVTVHFVTPTDINYKIQNLSDMEQVVDFINNMTGFYFDINDYSYDFASEKKTGKRPLLMAKKVITSDTVQGSKAFNKYFGPDGEFADYLYNADGTPKFTPDSEDAQDLDGAKKDVSVVSKYPVVWVGARVYSRNHKTGKEREIKPLDFRGTAIVVKESCDVDEGALGAGVGNVVGGIVGGTAGSALGPVGAALGKVGGRALGAALGAGKGHRAKAAAGSAVGGLVGGGLGSAAGAALGGAVSEESNSEREMLLNAVAEFSSVIEQAVNSAQLTLQYAQKLQKVCKDNSLTTDINGLVQQSKSILDSAKAMSSSFNDGVYAKLNK